MAAPRKIGKTKKKSAARKRAAPADKLTGALAEAAWLEADASLALALSEFEALEAAADAEAREEALLMLGQALSRAARRRGLTRFGAIDAREPYDPVRHELSPRPARAPKTVRVLSRGVARGGEVLVKARAEAARKARSR